MDREELHKKLFDAHRLFTSASGKIHEAIVILTAEGRYPEEREKFKLALADLVQSRDMADSAWKKAAEARTSIIRATGCDGKCS